MDAATLTAASGALVPKDTIVRPTTNGGIPNALAILDAPSTKRSAHFINNTKPITIKIKFRFPPKKRD